jgi:hypothetical protein
MFGSTILDLAIGLIFTFLTISLVTSAVTEAFASALAWRANTLLDGVKALLNDKDLSGLALSIYNHGLVNPCAAGTAQTAANVTVKPSYIDPKQFACALIDVAKLSPSLDVQTLKQNVNNNVADPQLNKMLNGMVDRAGGNINRVRDDITGWFDTGMDRVAGVYKRKTQLWGFAIAIICAIALNVNTIKMAQALWDQPMVMKSVAAPQTGETAQAAVDQLQGLGLPFGWDQKAVASLWHTPDWDWLFALVGWFITAIATLFGAPFWFDTLQRFTQLRGAGSK